MTEMRIPINAAGALVDREIAKAWADAMAAIDAMDDLPEAEREQLRHRAREFVIAERERQRRVLISKFAKAGNRVPADFAKGDAAAMFNGIN